MKDPITTIGSLLEGEQSRDAIHIAIAPAVAAEKLVPGEHVGLDEKGEATAAGAPIGIVDPYLDVKSLQKGARFWLFLYPNSVTGMRHHWAHPSFGPLDATKISHADHVTKSKAWIAEHAQLLGLSVDVLMENADQWVSNTGSWPDIIVQHGSERWRDNFDSTNFWHHYEIVRGVTVSEDRKGSMYCCSC